MLKNVNAMIDKCKDYRIILLKGSMGSGKTYFVQNYMKNVYDFNDVTSPTFIFLNDYIIDRLCIAHIDCYNKINYNLLHEVIINYDKIFIEWFEYIDKEYLSLLSNYIVIDCDKDMFFDIY